MKRFLLIPLFALLTAASVGCTITTTPAIPASAPGDTFGQSGKASQTGPYTLYRVTQWDMWGAPVNAEKVKTIDLQAADRVGFDYVLKPEDRYKPDAQSDVVAYAGNVRMNLGPIHSFDEKYFWADANQWDSYWSGRAERVLARKFTMY